MSSWERHCCPQPFVCIAFRSPLNGRACSEGVAHRTPASFAASMSLAAPAKARAYAAAFRVAYANSASSRIVAASRATSDHYAVWNAFSAMNWRASELMSGSTLTTVPTGVSDSLGP